MRAFYLNFPIRHAARSESIEERRKALPPELSWTHYRILLKVKNPEEKVFYMNECIENQWQNQGQANYFSCFFFLFSANFSNERFDQHIGSTGRIFHLAPSPLR
jgi:hypothetical protein